MTKTKRFRTTIIVLVVLMMFSIMPMGAVSATESIEVGVYTRQTGVDHDFVFIEDLSINTNISLQDADAVVVNFNEISSIAGVAKDLVDSGVLLYISAPEVGRLELSNLLGIPISGIPRYNNLVLLGVYVSNINGIYVWGNHYAPLECEELSGAHSLQTIDADEMLRPENDHKTFENVITVSEALAMEYFSIDLMVESSLNGIFENHLDTIYFTEQMME